MWTYRWLGFLVMVLVLPVLGPKDMAHASCVVESSGTYAEGTNIRDDKCDTAGNKKGTIPQLGGEHIGATEADGYLRVITDVGSSAEITADAQIKDGPGYVSHMICAGTDAAAVAGTIILYDSLTETGTVIYTLRIAALDYHIPMVIPVLRNAATGIYLGYTTTSDVNCTVFYR